MRVSHFSDWAETLAVFQPETQEGICGHLQKDGLLVFPRPTFHFPEPVNFNKLLSCVSPPSSPPADSTRSHPLPAGTHTPRQAFARDIFPGFQWWVGMCNAAPGLLMANGDIRKKMPLQNVSHRNPNLSMDTERCRGCL